jgi:hypothetical protein
LVGRIVALGALAFTLGSVTTACRESDPADDDAGDGAAELQALSPAELLTRASLDIRGRRPSSEELDTVERDPQAVRAMIASFVDDPAFGERVKSMFAGAWRSRIDTYPDPEGYFQTADGTFHEAAGEEPLNLLAFIAVNDRPYTELVTATETFVDPVLLQTWPMEELPTDEAAWVPAGTVRARYSDGRPLSGVLTMNSVYWRHSSTVENANRGRANALSQALLCQSYLDRPIDFPTDLDLTDSESIRSAIRESPACQACHSTLDPLASYLWGFMYPNELPAAEYSIELERAWQIYTDVAPGFYGVPGSRLVDLGRQVAEDDRFVSCAVRRVYEGLLGRTAALQDEGALAEHREAFLDGGLSLKALVRSVLDDPSYHGRSWQPRFGGEPEPVALKVAPVDVLASSLTELSGRTLTLDGRPSTRLDRGVRTLAGGSDRGDTKHVSTGAVLVQRRLAEAGAIHLVDSTSAGVPAEGRLAAILAGQDLGAAPSNDTVIALVRAARSRTLAREDAQIAELLALWEDVAALGNPPEAWTAILTAVLADPDHLLY